MADRIYGLVVSEWIAGEEVMDWEALFDFLQYCGLSVDEIYKTVLQYRAEFASQAARAQGPEQLDFFEAAR